MRIAARMLRLFKADLHGVMDQLEDKPALLKQCLREMENGLRQKRCKMAELDRTGRRLRNDLLACGREREQLEQDIALAVRKEKDDIARLLIRKQMAVRTGADHLAGLLRQLEEEKIALAETLDRRQGQYDHLKVKAAAYCRNAEQYAADETAAWWAEPEDPTDAEIEMELLRRKESLSPQGGVL
jgi:phage shock protein A